MNPIIKTRELVEILKSGITGALALTGVGIILVILANLFNMPFVSHPLAKMLAQCTLAGLFTATASFGFILGLVVRRRLPIIQKGIAPMAIAAIPLILGTWVIYTYASYVDSPIGMKITDCTNRVVKVHFKFPKGRGYHLMFATASSPTNAFSGRICITSGAITVVDFPIRTEPVGWLKNYGVPSGFNVIGDSMNTNSPPLYRFVQAQKDYVIEITFDQPPPPSTSIWLYWLQAAKDRDR